MKKSIVLSALLALALALALAGCDSGSGGGGGGGNITNNPLNGAWIYVGDGDIVCTVTNSSVFVRNNEHADEYRGTCGVSGNRITLTLTEVYFNQERAYDYNTTVGWKTFSQVVQILNNYPDFGNVNEFVRMCNFSGTYTLESGVLTIYNLGFERESLFVRQ